MKYLILTDIHGSSYYLDLVFNKVKEFDKLILLGDILYHGPRNDLPNGYNPKEVINILNTRKDKIIAIRGNCDANVDLMVLDFKINQNNILNYNGKKIFLTHGDVYDKKNPYKEEKCDYMIYGHYHKNEMNINNNVCYINLGSLSIPKDNHHSFAILEDEKYISYDLFSDEVLLEVGLNG